VPSFAAADQKVSLLEKGGEKGTQVILRVEEKRKGTGLYYRVKKPESSPVPFLPCYLML
jgi:hypothetical protein